MPVVTRSAAAKAAAAAAAADAAEGWAHTYTQEVKLPAGTYYFGDICYPLGHTPIYEVMWAKSGYENGHFSKGDQHIVVHRTAWGDGEYRDLGNAGVDFAYPVDAGVLGLVSTSLIDMDKFKKSYQPLPGRIMRFATPVHYEVTDAGVFHVQGFDARGFVVEAYVDTR